MWKPKQVWKDVHGGDGGFCGAKDEWSVEGPAPFGGLRCKDEDHAVEVCKELNARKPGPKKSGNRVHTGMTIGKVMA